MERERATVEDRCNGHTDGTDLVYGLTIFECYAVSHIFVKKLLTLNTRGLST